MSWTDRPDFRVNSPNRRTPFLSAASMKATFSASIPADAWVTELMLFREYDCMQREEEKEKKVVDRVSRFYHRPASGLQRARGHLPVASRWQGGE